MNRDELLFDKIEAYLRGQLPPTETAAFEAEIAADPTLVARVKAHRLERQGLEWLVERDLQAKMAVWEREAEQVRPTLRPSFVRRWRWAIGAAAMLALGVFGWWLLQPQADIGGPTPIVTAPKPKTPVNSAPKPPKSSQKPPVSQPEEKDDRVAETPQPSPEIPTPKPEIKPPTPNTPPDYPSLASTYYNEEDFIQTSKGEGNVEAPGYGQALDSYKSGKYSDAEKLLKPILKLNPNAVKTKELLAHSLYKKGQYAAAVPYFSELSNSKDKAIAERSEWALALTLLHKVPTQKPLLNQVLDRILAKPNHTFYAKAKELKTQIK